MQQEEGQALCQAVQLAAAPRSPSETGAGAAKCIRLVCHVSCTLPLSPRISETSGFAVSLPCPCDCNCLSMNLTMKG